MELNEYTTHDATGLAALVADGEVCAADLLALARSQAELVNPALNAIVQQMGELADSRAREPLSGPLAGVPFLLKDLAQEYAGFPSTHGSRSLVKDVAAEHAVVVQRWLDAGLVIFGRTNTPEFGAKGITEPVLWGPARNPWNTAHTPGGSSGGSAAAVAAGIVPAAGASDGGGSIRVPASCCGLFGLKPSRGRVPSGPANGERMLGLVVDGVISRSVRDSVALLEAIIGPEPTAEYVMAQPFEPIGTALERPPGRVRIGVSSRSAITATPSPEAVAAVTAAAALLTDLGHEVDEVDPPCDDAALARDFLTIWFAVVAAQVADARKRLGATSRDFEADTLAMAELGRAGGVVAVIEAQQRRHGYLRAMRRFHGRYDYLLTPTQAQPPPRIGQLDTPMVLQRLSRVVAALRGGKLLEKLSILDQLVQENLGWIPYTQLANMTGLPAMSVPLHWTAEGLPLGVQFVGRLGTEPQMLQLAAQLEQAQPWASRRPVLPA
jgi:Asp-tRNA(Asn)/Glu-tRNA(Gln) amidotransferase A subunit family amidase